MYELHDALRDISKIFSLFDELDFDLVWARFWTTYEKYFLYIWNFFLTTLKQSDSNLIPIWIWQNSVLGWEPEQSRLISKENQIEMVES